MWSTDGGPRDPVKLFKLSLSKRPQPMRNQGPLYLTIIQRPKNDDVWYTKVRMGQNTIGKIMPRMTSSLESSTAKKLTNHSTRKTVVQKLKSAGQPRYKIKEITGHASEESLNGTGHKVSTTPGWRVAPDFFKKFNTPHKRKGTISSPIQILLKYFVPHILY